MLNGESTDVLIKEIYEPYYKRFKEYFGNTLTGFFNDEPRFCNGVNPYYFAHVDMYGNKAGKASYSLLVVPHGYLPHETEKLIENLKIPVVYTDGANVKNLAKFHIRLIHGDVPW